MGRGRQRNPLLLEKRAIGIQIVVVRENQAAVRSAATFLWRRGRIFGMIWTCPLSTRPDPIQSTDCNAIWCGFQSIGKESYGAKYLSD